MVSWLLDTNFLIYILEHSEAATVLLGDKLLYAPSPGVGELYFGARKSARVDYNIIRIRDLISGLTVLGCDEATAEIYGDIKAKLRAKGKPIPDNDIWIAALALQYDLILVTKDRHFSYVDSLITTDW